MADVTLQNKYYTICGQWSASIYYGTEASITIGALPAWISGSIDTVNKVLSLDFDSDGVTAGTYTYDVGDFDIIVNVYDSCTQSIPACCTDSVDVRWINREGGWQNMQFDKIRGYQLRQSGSITFKNDLTTKYQRIGDVFNAERLKIDVFTRDQYDYLIGLKYSIQAFINGQPILIDTESFPKYDQDTRIYEVGFTFIHAEQLNVQGQ